MEDRQLIFLSVSFFIAATLLFVCLLAFNFLFVLLLFFFGREVGFLS